MVDYDKETRNLLDRVDRLQECCKSLQRSLVNYTTHSENSKKGFEKLVSKKSSVTSYSPSGLLGLLFMKYADEYKGTDLSEPFCVLGTTFTSLCTEEITLSDDIKKHLLGSCTTFLEVTWPPLQKEIKSLENLRVAYDSAVKKVVKNTHADKSSKLDSVAKECKEKYEAQVLRTTTLLKHACETESTLKSGLKRLAHAQMDYHKSCLKYLADSIAKISAE
uniref:BAR domain-containing protein n=1 Tax=Mesocestoides corti TaxID=53468 RepID=A0A5K3F4U1_MESCO